VTTVLGENGLMLADTLMGRLSLFENGCSVNAWDEDSVLRSVSEGAVQELAVSKVEPLLQEHKVFQAALARKSESGLVTIRQGLEVIRVAERLIDTPN
jgi:hypothetical protein